MFSEFWMLYPKKHAKKYAEKCFNRLSLADKQAALDGLQKYLKYWEIRGTDSEYIMNPSTYINQARWEDELDLEPSKPKIPEPAWWASEASIIAKGKELGIHPLPGQDLFQLKGRIIDRLKQVA